MIIGWFFGALHYLPFNKLISNFTQNGDVVFNVFSFKKGLLGLGSDFPPVISLCYETCARRKLFFFLLPVMFQRFESRSLR